MVSNARTLEAYEQGVDAYIIGTANVASGFVKNWIDDVLKLIPFDAAIIEIGSAFGRDAKYIESKGYKVKCTDATVGFVRTLHNEGLSATVFNILKDDFESTYDLIFANAVFLHFTRAELKDILEKAHRSLNQKGFLAFSVKYGEGEEWTTEKVGHPRFFCYWTEEPLKELLLSIGFAIHSIILNEKWLQVVVTKDA